MEKQKFSIARRARSFRYAGAGLTRFLQTEHNARIHLAATLLVIAAALALKVSWDQAAILAIAIGLVWVTEMINTCLERAMDLLSQKEHPEIKFIKDLAAGAVLTASVIAVIIGLFIFIPKFL
jgi:diacylglycerol kinase (ATP)